MMRTYELKVTATKIMILTDDTDTDGWPVICFEMPRSKQNLETARIHLADLRRAQETRTQSYNRTGVPAEVTWHIGDQGTDGDNRRWTITGFLPEDGLALAVPDHSADNEVVALWALNPA